MAILLIHLHLTWKSGILCTAIKIQPTSRGQVMAREASINAPTMPIMADLITPIRIWMRSTLATALKDCSTVYISAPKNTGPAM